MLKYNCCEVSEISATEQVRFLTPLRLMGSVIAAMPVAALVGQILFPAVVNCVSPGQRQIRLVAKQNDAIKIVCA